MCRKHRVDGKLTQQLEQLVGLDTGGLQPEQAVANPAGLGPVAAALVGATATDAMDLLGEIHHLEPAGKGPHQVSRFRRCAVAGSHHQLDGAFRLAVPAPDCGNAIVLDLGQQLVPALVAQYLADQAAERVDIVPERGVFRREMYVLSLTHGDWASGNKRRDCDDDIRALYGAGRGSRLLLFPGYRESRQFP